MKLVIDINESKVPFFMELLDNLDFVQVLEEVSDEEKVKVIHDLVEAFDDVRSHLKGEKQLTSAKDLLNEV